MVNTDKTGADAEMKVDSWCSFVVIDRLPDSCNLQLTLVISPTLNVSKLEGKRTAEVIQAQSRFRFEYIFILNRMHEK